VDPETDSPVNTLAGSPAGSQTAPGTTSGNPSPTSLNTSPGASSVSGSPLPPVSPGEPEVLASGLGLPGRIAFDGEGIVVIDHQHYTDDTLPDVLLRVPLDGSAPTPLLEASSIEGFVLAEDRVWVNSYAERAVIAFDRATGERALEIPVGDSVPTQMAQTESALYVAVGQSGLAKIDKQTGTLEPLWQNSMGSATWILSGPDSVVFPMNSPDGAGQLFSVSHDGRVQIILASRGTPLRGIALWDQDVVFTDYAGTVERVALTGGNSEVIANLPQPWAVLPDGDNIYVSTQPDYCNDTTLGAVYRVPLDGTEPELLAANQRCPSTLLADAGALYWANNGSASMSDEGHLEVERNGSLVKLNR
jgi:hypothetical protein